MYQKHQTLRFELFLEAISGSRTIYKLELVSAKTIFFDQRSSLSALVSSTFNRNYVQSQIVEFTKNFTHLLWYSIKLHNMNAAVLYFAQEFYARSRQGKVTRILEKIFRRSTFLDLYFHGLVFQISGKLGRRSPRKRILKVLRGFPPKYSSYSVRINYTYQQAVSSFGVYGVKA